MCYKPRLKALVANKQNYFAGIIFDLKIPLVTSLLKPIVPNPLVTKLVHSTNKDNGSLFNKQNIVGQQKNKSAACFLMFSFHSFLWKMS